VKWNWFGYFGLLNLAAFIGLVLFPSRVPEGVPTRVASVLLPLMMLFSVAFPIVASVRSTKWWIAA
jgi:hypothetical protein